MQHSSLSIFRRIRLSKTSLLWPAVAWLGAAVFYAALILLIIALIMAFYQGFDASISREYGIAWAALFGALFAIHLLFQSSTRLLLWRETSCTSSARSWMADLNRMLSLDFGLLMLDIACSTAQIASFIGIFLSDQQAVNGLIFVFSTLASLFIAILYRVMACFLFQMQNQTLFTVWNEALSFIRRRPLTCALSTLMPKLADMLLMLTLGLFIAYAVSHAAILCVAAVMLIVRWLEPICWHHMLNATK